MEGGGNGLDGRGVVAVPPWKGRIPNRRSPLRRCSGQALRLRSGPAQEDGAPSVLSSEHSGSLGCHPPDARGDGGARTWGVIDLA